MTQDTGAEPKRQAPPLDEAPQSSDEPPKSFEGAPIELGRAPLHKIDRRLTLVLVFVAIGIYLPLMGTYGMFDPWETHYTEVAREFMENNDWLATKWHNGTGPEGYAERNFWSKPVGSFWLSGLSLKLLGYQDKITLRGVAKTHGEDPGKYITEGSVEWAVRLPFFLCALFGMLGLYWFVARIFGPRAGLLAGIALATSPMWFMIGRQAMTDMPYVGLMSGGLAFFALGAFGRREVFDRRKHIKIARWKISWTHAGSYYAFLGAFATVMALQLYAVISGLLRTPLFHMGGMKISAAVVMVLYVVGALAFIWMSRKTTTRNEVYLYIFYMAVAMGGWSKGLIGALQPGLVILVYLLTSREWRLLAEVALARGLVLAFTVFAPWYHGMLLRFGRSWWNELFGTEQFRRLTIGEQKQAKGTWEYYVQQIGYGIFPWVAFLPAALIRTISIGFSKHREGRERAQIFVSVWFAAAILLFTLTVTKYHHYILPAIPPAVILAVLFIDDLLAKRVRGTPVALAAGFVVFALVGMDLIRQPAHWVWMYTYLYTSNWARGVPEGTPILIYTLILGAWFLLAFWPKARKLAIVGFTVATIFIGGYILNWHQVHCAPHWSQKYVLKTYYKLRKNPKEELIAWQFNWRGETWHTAAQVVVSKSLDNKKIKKWLKERAGRRFFFITERSRYGSLRGMLPTAKGKKTLKIVDDSNIHYVLAAATL
ncbi:MAG: glycosyltransferase family 39 protein [Deltaproteobacteria bacterium]|nr:glycosyltransferase family 39 protein [Deltaproteobacteria bacterium]